MFDPARLERLHAELIELYNQPGLPAVTRGDTEILLDDLARLLPPDERRDQAAAERAVEAGGEQATQAPPPAPSKRKGRSKTWMAGETGPAEVPPAAAEPAPEIGSRGEQRGSEPLPSVGSPAKRLDVEVTPTGAGYEVAAGSPGQEDAARTVRELLNGLVGRKLTPLGEVAHDLVLAVERRDVELQAFLGVVYAGKPLLEAAVDLTTPAGQAVANWFNTLTRFRA